METETKRDRYRTGLLLGVFTRRCLLAEAEKDGPASSILARGSSRVPHPCLPTQHAVAVAAGNRRGTHSPLTVAAPRGNLTHFA